LYVYHKIFVELKQFYQFKNLFFKKVSVSGLKIGFNNQKFGSYYNNTGVANCITKAESNGQFLVLRENFDCNH